MSGPDALLGGDTVHLEAEDVKPQQQSRFFQLPQEIRSLIYSFAFSTEPTRPNEPLAWDDSGNEIDFTKYDTSELHIDTIWGFSYDDCKGGPFYGGITRSSAPVGHEYYSDDVSPLGWAVSWLYACKQAYWEALPYVYSSYDWFVFDPASINNDNEPDHSGDRLHDFLSRLGAGAKRHIRGLRFTIPAGAFQSWNEEMEAEMFRHMRQLPSLCQVKVSLKLYHLVGAEVLFQGFGVTELVDHVEAYWTKLRAMPDIDTELHVPVPRDVGQVRWSVTLASHVNEEEVQKMGDGSWLKTTSVEASDGAFSSAS